MSRSQRRFIAAGTACLLASLLPSPAAPDDGTTAGGVPVPQDFEAAVSLFEALLAGSTPGARPGQLFGALGGAQEEPGGPLFGEALLGEAALGRGLRGELSEALFGEARGFLAAGALPPEALQALAGAISGTAASGPDGETRSRLEVGWGAVGDGAVGFTARHAGIWRLGGRLAHRSTVRLAASWPFEGAELLVAAERFLPGRLGTVLDRRRGPLDAREQGADGPPASESFLAVSQETTWEVSRRFTASFFAEAGNTYPAPETIDPADLSAIAGIGLRLATPWGPVSLSYARDLDAAPGRGRSQVYLAFGTAAP